MKVKSESEVAESCPTLTNPMGCSPPGSSVHGVFQARVPSFPKSFMIEGLFGGVLGWGVECANVNDGMLSILNSTCSLLVYST